MSINGFPFYSLSEASEMVGLTTGRLRQMLRAKTLEGRKAGPRAWIIPAKEVKRLLKKPAKLGRPRGGKKSCK